MRGGVGGPLLCIGDLLADVAADDDDGRQQPPQGSSAPSSPTAPIERDRPFPPSDLHHLFQENYNKLIESLSGTDHSWTASTLKLCAALKIADKLVNSANSNIESLLEQIGVLEGILERGDRAVATAKAIQGMRVSEHCEEPEK